MTKIQRVRKTCNWLIYKGFAENDKELAEKLGYSKSSFSQIMNEKVPISDKFIENLTSVDKNINKVWILTGEGEIIKTSTSENIDAEYGEKDQLNISDKEVIEYIINNKEELLKNKSFLEMLDILDIDRAIIAEKKKQKSMIEQFRERMMKKHGHTPG